MGSTSKKQLIPEEDSIVDRSEQIIGVWIHGQQVFAVRILLQGFVDPVHKGYLLLLCST